VVDYNHSPSNSDCSEVIKGLVFKKNTAHKHMPTNFHNPRLLLLKGVLGHSGAGLSSFNSMDQVGHYIYTHLDSNFQFSFIGQMIKTFYFVPLTTRKKTIWRGLSVK
jgi:hypothetical protein